jgi:hypothetical protein
VDVHYLGTGGARAAAVLAADATFAHVQAERTAVVPWVPPSRPGEFYLRELPPLRAVLDDLSGLVPAGPVGAYWSAVAHAPPAGGHGHGRGRHECGRAGYPDEREPALDRRHGQVRFSPATPTTIQGRMVVRILTRAYPNRMRKGTGSRC